MASSQTLLPSARPYPANRSAQAQTAALGMFSTFDRTHVKRDPKATAMSVVINGLIVISALTIGAATVAKKVVPLPAKVVTLVDPYTPPPPRAPVKTITMSGGGGHTSPIPTPVTRGNPPVMAPRPVVLVTTEQPRITPKLAIAPSVNVQPDLKLAKANTPALGMPTAGPSVAVSLGNGSGAGLGAGIGGGLGNGSGGNYGGGVFKVGGGVAAPTVVSAPEPSFTDEARQAKVSGKVVVYLQVSPDGHPMHVRVVKGLGMGLDEKAIEAVRQYKFKPATKDGHPVTVEMNIDVNFQIV